MADLPRYEKWALLLTAGFVLFTGGWFLAGHSSPEPYTITAARPDGSVPLQPDGSRSDEGGRPDSLLEGEIIDLNTAAPEDLERLPGIGPAKAEAIAAFSPRQTVLAASFLVGLYALKSLSVCFPMSALTAAGGLLFPFPLALAVNLCGTGVAQTIPFFLGRREQGGLEALAERIPRVAGVCRAQAENPWLSVFLLRLAGASPGDVVSLYLGASGTPYGTYLSAGLLGGLPRIACATVLGGALWQPGSGRFWLSLAAGGALTALSGVIWLLWRRRRRA